MPANRAGKTLEKNKLIEILREVSALKVALQHNELMLSTPPKNIEDSCCMSALQCFQENLRTQFNGTQNRLYRRLMSPITERGLCNGGAPTSTGQDCDSHLTENVQEFFSRLESLIQRAIVRLSMN